MNQIQATHIRDVLFYLIGQFRPATESDYWVQQIEAAASLQQIANALLNSNEGRSMAADFLKLAEFWPFGIKPEAPPSNWIPLGVGPNIYSLASSPSGGCGPQWTDPTAQAQLSRIAKTWLARYIRFWCFQALNPSEIQTRLVIARSVGLIPIMTLTNQWMQCEPLQPSW